MKAQDARPPVGGEVVRPRDAALLVYPMQVAPSPC
jgi:hypothetical protein